MRILLIAYDNGSFIHWFPQGTAYIAAALLNEGFDVEIYNQDMHHYPDEHLTEHLNAHQFDIIGVGVIGGYYQYRKLLNISEAINRTKKRPFFVIGGHGPSPEPEYFLNKTQADAIVIGEGEETIVELVHALSAHKTLANIKGIAFRNGRDCVVNERRELVQNLDTKPLPAFHKFPIEYYRLIKGIPHITSTDFAMPVLSGRGCPFHCTFCYRMDKGHRLRSNESIVEEIQLLQKKYGINYIFFSDELLMVSKERTVNFCNALIKAKLNIRWFGNGRLNYAKPDILKLMKQAGCVFINYGIEAMDDQVLKNMKKGLTTRIITQGIEETLISGISPGLNMLFGNIGDNRETLKKAVKFLLKYDDGAQMRTIRPVTPYPGSELYYYAIQHELLKDCGDFYEKKHINSDLVSVNFTEMCDDEFHSCLYEANKTLINNYFHNAAKYTVEQARKLYQDKGKDFRGFRQT